MRTVPLATALTACIAGPLAAQQVDVETLVLDNGMEFLLVPRDNQPNSIAAGWAAKVGSVNEHPGITGISHFFEHMMFKGTGTIGTNDAERDAEYRRLQEDVRSEILRLVWGEQYRRFRRGEIDDPWNPAGAPPELRALQAELARLMDEHRSVIEKDEFDKVYSRCGGTRMNAFTSEDMTFFFINVPSNKFELWAWMESDRLGDSVFREFYSERDVVHEERRMRVESTPTGPFQEQFDAMFWMASPYSWPVIGWPSDLNSYTLEEARHNYDTYYCPNNLVGVVVGDFDPAEVKPVIHRYFGRLQRGGNPPPVVTIEIEQRAEQRLYAEVDAQPQVEVRYHAVPHGHADSYPLDLLADILNGRTGRLHQALVEGREIASRARAGLDARKYAGAFSFRATGKGGADPEELEKAWYEVLERLKTEPVGERELQKVKNQSLANAVRMLRQDFFLLMRLANYEVFGGWEYINEYGPRIQAVTAADIQRVANRYFTRENRSVAIFRRKPAAAGEDAGLAAFTERQRTMIERMLGQLETASIEEVTSARNQLRDRIGQAPEPLRPVLDYVVSRLTERIEQQTEGGAK